MTIKPAVQAGSELCVQVHRSLILAAFSLKVCDPLHILNKLLVWCSQSESASVPVTQDLEEFKRGSFHHEVQRR